MSQETIAILAAAAAIALLFLAYSIGKSDGRIETMVELRKCRERERHDA